MKITQLSLSNYRGVSELSLPIHEKLNVFFGVNGAGKSSILDAIAVMLSWTTARIQRAGSSGRPISEHDIANGRSSATIELICKYDGQEYGWKLLKNRRGYSSGDGKSNLSGLNELCRQFQHEIIAGVLKVNLPVFVYYPVNRAVLDIPLRIRGKHRFDIFAAYEGSLTSGANFRTFFEWFREREDLENENRKYKNAFIKPDDFQFPDPQLEAVRSALNQFLPEFENLTVRRSPLRMEVNKGGRRLTVNQLSDGEKCLIALICDLARRFAIANPLRDKPLEGSGIVIIDEVDLHLHPKWQRLVVPKLQAVFPNCQFFISTHSPHVITHVHPESLYLLKQTDKGIIAEHPTESYGKNVDRILEDLMGLDTTRPDEIASALRQVFQKIKDGDLSKLGAEIATLKRQIGSDPDLVKAEVLIKRKEIIGK